MSRIIVNVADTLQKVQRGLRSPNQRVRDSAESVLSGLILHLRTRDAILPAELQPSLDTLDQGDAAA